MTLDGQKKMVPDYELYQRPGFGKEGHSFELHTNFYGVRWKKIGLLLKTFLFIIIIILG